MFNQYVGIVKMICTQVVIISSGQNDFCLYMANGPPLSMRKSPPLRRTSRQASLVSKAFVPPKPVASIRPCAQAHDHRSTDYYLRGHDALQSRSALVVKLLLHELANTAVVPLVCITQVLAHPRFDVCDLWQRVLSRTLAGVESGESCTKAEIVNVAVLNDIVRSLRKRRIDEKLEEGLACDGPTALGVALDESLAVAQSASERNDCGLAVVQVSEFRGG
jgi:hypothetical protein